MAAAALAALLVLLVAVTPLSAVIQPGDFELLLQTPGYCGNSQGTALLRDETGLVQGLTISMASGEPELTQTRTLFVDWEGDSDLSTIGMEFSAPKGRYKLEIRTMSAARCDMGVWIGFRFALLLRAPVDPTSVDVIGGATARE